MIWYVPHIHFIILCYVLLSLTDYQIWSIIYLVSTNSKKRAHKTNQYMTKLYHDLLSNSPQTVTIDIPADMGTGQISQVVTKQGAVVSDWKMNYFSYMNVQGVSCEDYIQLLFCFNAASSDAFRQGLRIENQHAYFKIQKTSMDCGHENMLY